MFKVLNTCQPLNFKLYTLIIEQTLLMYQQQWNITVKSQCFCMAVVE
jgi:hypothetical protein